MKNSKGITLVSLAVTIVVLIILASIATYSGISSIKSSKLMRFQQELEIMQAEVNYLYEKYKDEETIELGEPLSNADTQKVQKAFTSTGKVDEDGYRYFNEATIEKLDIAGIEYEYIVNIKEREVICLDGFELDGVIYYNLEQLTNKKIIKGDEIERGDVSFSVSTEENGVGGWKINISDIKYSKYVGKGTIQYKKVDSDKWITVENIAKIKNYNFVIRNEGEYIIKITDAAKQTGEAQIILKSRFVADSLGIKPVINSEEMIPVKYDEVNKIWIDADPSIQGDWFDYSTKKWANVETENGYFVYIPRYAYKITEGYHETREDAGTIAIVFLNEDNTLKTTIDSQGNTVSESDLIHASDVDSAEAGVGLNATTKYIIHPAFEAFDTADKNIDGLWVAKYEMSMEETTDEGITWLAKETSDSTIGDILTSIDTTKRMVSKSGVSSWRNIQVTNIFENCYEMNRILDSHMMKNTEWGAVAYLTVSKYGKGATSEVEQNKSSSYLTGHGADSTLSTGAASTTGTMYGIFDMVGGAYEFVAGYLEDDCLDKENGWRYSNSANLVNADDKYKDIYSILTNEDGTTSNVYTDCYTVNNLKVGDALWEVTNNTGNTYAWYENYSSFVGLNDSVHYPVFLRSGGYGTSGTRAGIFFANGNFGNSYDSGSFRTVCVVE